MSKIKLIIVSGLLVFKLIDQGLIVIISYLFVPYSYNILHNLQTILNFCLVRVLSLFVVIEMS